MNYATGQTFWDSVSLGLVIAALAVAILPWLNRDNVLVRTVTIGVCLAVTWRYLVWRVLETLPPLAFNADFLLGLVFLVVEGLAIVGTTVSLVLMTRIKSRSPDADRNTPWLASLPRKPLVDVLICTYNEDETILERTIIGAQALDYENFRLWVCDDGRRPWLQALCSRLGCGYLTRPDNAHAKAGNINSAMRHLAALPEPPDFISILDADFVVRPQFLSRAMTLTKDEHVGVVQTPQHFFNPDPIQSNLRIAKVWPDEQRFFFDVVLASKDAWDGAFCCGTSSVIRFAPLVAIGGFPTDSVTEDYLLTLRLKEAGYSTVYLNEPLSVGLAPEGLKEYITQRSRWCLGFMQIFRGRSGPLRLDNNLTLFDRVLLIETFLHWSMTYTFRLLGLIVPAVYLLFDIQAVYAHVTDAVNHVFPYFVAQVALITWLTRGRVLPILADVSQLLGATEIVRSVAIGLAKPQGHKFKVTAKGGDRATRFVQWPMLRIFLGYLALTGAGILWAFVIDDSRPLADSSALALFWSWYNILVLTLACFVSIEERQRRDGERFQAHDAAVVRAGGRTAVCRVFDISVSGMAFFGQSPAPQGSAATVRVGDVDVPGIVIRDAPNSFAVTFTHDERTRAHLIRHVYSGRYSAMVETVEPGTVAAGLLARLWH
jgi:cellulose synthase (UDP-forming)